MLRWILGSRSPITVRSRRALPGGERLELEDVFRQPLQEGGELAAEDRDDQQHQQDEAHQRQPDHHQRGDEAVDAEALQPAW